MAEGEKRFSQDFAHWTNAITNGMRLMIENDVTGTEYFVTIHQLLDFIIANGGLGGTAYGGLLTTEQDMDDAITGKFYAFTLSEEHSQLPAWNGALQVFNADEADGIIQIASIIVDEKVKQYARFGVTDNYSAFAEIAGASSSKITTIDPTSIAVGGIPAGTVLTDKTTLEVIDMMLYPELFQQASGIVAPSSEFELSTTGLQEVGAELILSISHSFNRGSISPKYQSASEFRSGTLSDYTETGSEGFYTVLPGVQSWTSKANYAAGVQPKGSKGTNHPSYGALPAGSTSTITRTITGVYPVYATTVNISVLTKQALLAHGAIVEVNLVAETGGNKQTVRIPSAWNITTLKQYNTLSGQWDSISLSTFTKSSAITLNGTTYYDYTHNGSTIGARKLRFE